MKKADYQIISQKDSKELAKFLSREGQFLLPMLELIEQAEAVVDEVIDVIGRASIEALLLLSAQQVAGPQHKGKNTGDMRWYGRQKGVVPLAERKLRKWIARDGASALRMTALRIYCIEKID